MAKALISLGGGTGGVDLDDLTATKDKVLDIAPFNKGNGYVFYGKGSDEPQSGTLKIEPVSTAYGVTIGDTVGTYTGKGNATGKQVLQSSGANNTGTKYTASNSTESNFPGTMVNYGTKTLTLNFNGTINLAEGYYSKVSISQSISLWTPNSDQGDRLSPYSGYNSGNPRMWTETSGTKRGLGLIVPAPNNSYITGANWVFAPEPNLIADNIREGVNIYGLVGTFKAK